MLSPWIQFAIKRSFCPRALPLARCNRNMNLPLNQTVRPVVTLDGSQFQLIDWLIDWIVFHTLNIGNISAIRFDDTVFWENKRTPNTGRLVIISASVQTAPNCFMEILRIPGMDDAVEVAVVKRSCKCRTLM